MIVPAIPVMAVQFGITAGTAAQTMTALAFGRLAGMPISGMVLDRLGTRSALIAGPALACCIAILAGLTPWFGVILLLIFIIGIAESVWVIAREVAGIDLARPDQRGRVLSGFHGINYMGLALGPLAPLARPRRGLRARLFQSYSAFPSRTRAPLTFCDRPPRASDGVLPHGGSDYTACGICSIK